jgi:hypothetical protein
MLDVLLPIPFVCRYVMLADEARFDHGERERKKKAFSWVKKSFTFYI